MKNVMNVLKNIGDGLMLILYLFMLPAEKTQEGEEP
jgi:hypothetical protein